MAAPRLLVVLAAVLALAAAQSNDPTTTSTSTSTTRNCFGFYSEEECDPGYCQWAAPCGPCVSKDVDLDTAKQCDQLDVKESSSPTSCFSSPYCLGDYDTGTCRPRSCYDYNIDVCACHSECKLVNTSTGYSSCAPKEGDPECRPNLQQSICESFGCNYTGPPVYNCHAPDEPPACSAFFSQSLCPSDRGNNPCMWYSQTVYDATGTRSEFVSACVDEGDDLPCSRIGNMGVCNNQDHCYFDVYQGYGRCFDCKVEPCERPRIDCRFMNSPDSCSDLEYCGYDPYQNVCVDCEADPDAFACQTTTTTPRPACETLNFNAQDCFGNQCFYDFGNNQCRDYICWDHSYDEESCNALAADRNCTFLRKEFNSSFGDTNIVSVCVDPVAEPTCGTFSQREQCDLVDQCEHFTVNQQFICYKPGDFDCTTLFTTTEKDCPSDRCEYDPMAERSGSFGVFGVCHNMGVELGCEFYRHEVTCGSKDQCRWDGYSSKCVAKDTPIDCSTFTEQLTCKLTEECRWTATTTSSTTTTTTTTKEGQTQTTPKSTSTTTTTTARFDPTASQSSTTYAEYRPCKPCDTTSCLEDVPTSCTQYSQNECYTDYRCTWISSSNSCNNTQCFYLSNAKVCNSLDGCAWQPSTARCEDEGTPLDCASIAGYSSSPVCDLTDGCAFSPVVGGCRDANFVPECSEIYSKNLCTPNSARAPCRWLDSIQSCVDEDWTPDCSRFSSTPVGCNNETNGRCKYIQDLKYFRRCFPSDKQPNCTFYDTIDACTDEQPRCDFDFVNYECRDFDKVETTTPTTTTTSTLDGCFDNPCVDTQCINVPPFGDYRCEPCPYGYVGEPDRNKTETPGCIKVQCPITVEGLADDRVSECSGRIRDRELDDTCPVKCKAGYTPASINYVCGEDSMWHTQDQLVCEDANECDAKPCHPLSTCSTPVFNDYQCGPCPDGYNGNGRGSEGCKNRNECLYGVTMRDGSTQSACDFDAGCTDKDPSTDGVGFQCGPCPDHKRNQSTWSPVGYIVKCVDINECEEGGFCDEHATCTNTVGEKRAYCGACSYGYDGSGFVSEGGCLPVDCGSELPASRVSADAEYDCGTNTKFGDKCVASCPDGFAGGSVEFQCGPDKRWTGRLTCDKITCPVPDVASVLASDTALTRHEACDNVGVDGTCRPVGCKPGFRINPVRNTAWTCNEDKTWTAGDVACIPCEPGTYQDKVHQTQCVSHSGGDCTSGQYLFSAATSSSNKECRDCSTCNTATHFKAADCKAAADTDCQLLTQCPLGISFELFVPTPTSDRVCRECSVCSKLHFRTAACSETEDTKCQSLTVCAVGKQRVLRAATATADRLCLDLPSDGTIPERTGHINFVKSIKVFIKNINSIKDNSNTATGGVTTEFYNILVAALSAHATEKLGSLEPTVTIIRIIIEETGRRRRLLAQPAVVVDYFVETESPSGTSITVDNVNKTLDEIDNIESKLQDLDPTLSLENTAPPSTTSAPSGEESSDSGLLIIIAAACGGAVLITIIIVCCICRRRSKGADLDTDYDISENPYAVNPIIAETSMMEVPTKATGAPTRSRQASFYSSIAASSDA